MWTSLIVGILLVIFGTMLFLLYPNSNIGSIMMGTGLVVESIFLVLLITHVVRKSNG